MDTVNGIAGKGHAAFCGTPLEKRRRRMSAQFRNLVFEGGGVKGIAYVGAMQVLSQRGLLNDIMRVGGTSAGAINALIFALGYDLQAQREILNSTDFRKFMDDSFGYIKDFKRLWTEFGWHKGDFFSDWVGSLIKRKLGTITATFVDLQKAGCPDLYVIGTNLSTGYAEIFSRERFPDMPLVTAVRISMSIPLFFRAKRFGERNDVYVDGGVMQNYPVKLFDRQRYIDMERESNAARFTDYYNRENARFLLERPGRSPYAYNCQTLGLRLDTAEEIALFRYDEPLKGEAIKTFPHYARALITAFMQVQENQHLHSDDWQRTIYINTLDVKTTDFNLTDEKKRALIQQGIDGAETYFKWFEDPEETPVHRLPPEIITSRPTLKKGDKGDDVIRLQTYLNRVGCMLKADGELGPATERGIRYAQELVNQPVTGISDLFLWTCLESKPEPFPLLDTNGVAFIALEETGGLAYYQSKACRPHFPGSASGITIGIGYDLRMNSKEDFLATWADHLPPKALNELAKDIGRPGTKKRVQEIQKLDIEVPFASAWSVFIEKTLPRFYRDTAAIYPSLDRLPGLCRSALVSIVYNRGNALGGDRRKEMKAIQSILSQADKVGRDKEHAKALLARVEEQIVSMKRLWDSNSGVFKRRQAEANLWRAGLDQW